MAEDISLHGESDPRWPEMAQDSPRWPRDGPRWPKKGPRWAQDGPKRAQDGPKRGPRWPKMGSGWVPRGLPTSKSKKGVPGSMIATPPGPVLGVSWGSIGAPQGPLGLILGLIFGILTRKARKPKNEGPPTRNAHFWGPEKALTGPC